MRFIQLNVRTARLVHGYDAQNQEIAETFSGEAFAPKLIAIDRIQSATERFVLVTSNHGRVAYWEYEGGLDALHARLAAAALVVP